MLAVLSMHVKAKKTDTKNDLSVSMATYNSNFSNSLFGKFENTFKYTYHSFWESTTNVVKKITIDHKLYFIILIILLNHINILGHHMQHITIQRLIMYTIFSIYMYALRRIYF